jgi:hypothetical protein
MAAAGGPAAEILAGSFNGVFRSTDGGTTWTNVALPEGPGLFDRVAVSIAPSNPDVAYVWGAVGATVYFYRRSGGTWSAQPRPADAFGSQAWYDWYCAAAPDRDNQVYCGGIESFRGDFVGGVWTWINLSNKGASGQSIHPDQHAIAFDTANPDTIYRPVSQSGPWYHVDPLQQRPRHFGVRVPRAEFRFVALGDRRHTGQRY